MTSGRPSVGCRALDGRPTAVLLDRDGTIVEECHYLSDPAQLRLLPGAAEGVRDLNQQGFVTVVVTNQSGIGRGYFSERRLMEIHNHLRSILWAKGAFVDAIYHCPHLPEDGCDCRKPRSGLAIRAARELGFTAGSSLVVGDKPCDIELGKGLGATSVLVRTGYGANHEESMSGVADMIVDDLRAVARLLSGQSPAARQNSET